MKKTKETEKGGVHEPLDQRDPAFCVTVPVIVSSDERGGLMTFSFADCVVDVCGEGDRKLGSFGGAMGGRYDFHVEGDPRTYTILGPAMWRAFTEARERSLAEKGGERC